MPLTSVASPEHPLAGISIPGPQSSSQFRQVADSTGPQNSRGKRVLEGFTVSEPAVKKSRQGGEAQSDDFWGANIGWSREELQGFIWQSNPDGDLAPLRKEFDGGIELDEEGKILFPYLPGSPQRGGYRPFAVLQRLYSAETYKRYDKLVENAHKQNPQNDVGYHLFAALLAGHAAETVQYRLGMEVRQLQEELAKARGNSSLEEEEKKRKAAEAAKEKAEQEVASLKKKLQEVAHQRKVVVAAAKEEMKKEVEDMRGKLIDQAALQNEISKLEGRLKEDERKWKAEVRAVRRVGYHWYNKSSARAFQNVVAQLRLLNPTLIEDGVHYEKGVFLGPDGLEIRERDEEVDGPEPDFSSPSASFTIHGIEVEAGRSPPRPGDEEVDGPTRAILISDDGDSRSKNVSVKGRNARGDAPAKW